MAEGLTRLLLVAHYFPPDGGAGTQRPASFCRFLPALGFEVEVVTRAVSDTERGHWEPRDDSVDANDRHVRINRAERQAGESWTDALERATGQVAARFKPELVLVTLGPFSHARIAFSVDGAASVLDLRDPWALDGWMVHRHWLAFRRELAQMRRALAHADGVVANVPGARTAFERLAPREGRTPYAVVTNGWEELDFPKVEPVPRRDRLVMRMSGTFLSSDFARLTPMRRIVRCLRTSGEHIDGRGRSPYFLLRALRALRNAGHPAGSEIVLEVAGQADALTLSLIEESGMGDAVRMLGYLPHSESVRFIREADALVLPMHGLPRGDRARMVPGKLYEYLATGRPILGLVPNGDARDWIAEHPHSAIAEPCDERAVVDALTKLHDAWLAGRTVPSVRSARTGEFTRRKQAAKLAEYLRRVLADRGR